MKIYKFIFWLKISKNPTNGFNYCTRGANFWEANYFGYRLSIGMPWKKGYIETMSENYVNDVNAINRKVCSLSFPMVMIYKR